MWSQLLLFLLCSSTLWEQAGKSSPQISFYSLWLTALLFAMALPLTRAGGASPHFAGPPEGRCWDAHGPHRAAQGSSIWSPWLSTGPGPVGMQLQPSLSAWGKKREDVGVELPPLPLVFARVLGGRPGQPNSAAGRCQNFIEQNCTSLFHWFCITIKEHPAESVTHTYLISFTVSVLIYAGCVFIKQRFIGTWNFITLRFTWVQIVSFSLWKRRKRFKRAHLPVALMKP